MKRAASLLTAILLISTVSAMCNSTQVDINSASAEELDKITGIGPAIASNIINSRPFKSVDDLINVSRIGNKTLEKIKQQGLACVSDEENNTAEEKDEKDIIEPVNNAAISTSADESKAESEETAELPAILLNPNSSNSKDIKSGDNKEILKRNLSFYGIITLCVVFSLLFLLKRRKSKNEFK